MNMLKILLSTVALPAALYFVALLVTGFFSRLAFDAIAVLSFLLLLMSWLASSGLDALVLFVMICGHATITAFARSRLPSVARRLAHGARPADGSG